MLEIPVVHPFSLLVSRALFLCPGRSTVKPLNMPSHLLFPSLLLPLLKLISTVFSMRKNHDNATSYHSFHSHCTQNRPVWMRTFLTTFEFQSAQVIPINALKICCHCDSPHQTSWQPYQIKNFPFSYLNAYHFTGIEKKIPQCCMAQSRGNSYLSLSHYSNNWSLISRVFHYSNNDMPGTRKVLHKWQILFLFERQITFLIHYSYFPLQVSLFIFPWFHFPSN